MYNSIQGLHCENFQNIDYLVCFIVGSVYKL